jgi:chaperone required for assembly of F1-ATPase
MAPNRFYKEVSVGDVGGLHSILLDGKPVKTPSGTILALPSSALAHAIAEEWRAQETAMKPQSMLLTKLANTAMDRVAPNPASVREQLLAFAKSDVVAYRAESPADLVERQAFTWDPLLAWARQRFGVSLRTASGLSFIEQDEAAIRALADALEGHDAFVLAGLYSAAALLGSLVISLALFERMLSPESAFAAANLEKIYQAERWGWDPQEIGKADAERAELNQISRFLDLLRK